MRLSEVGSDLASYLFAHCGPMLKIGIGIGIGCESSISDIAHH